MTAPLFDHLAYADRSARGRIEVREDAAHHITTQALDWPGTLLEAGANYVTGVDAVALGHHYVGLNVDRRPIVMRGVRRSQGGDVTLAPGQAWVLPAGENVSFSVEPLHQCVRLTIDPRHADALLEHTPGDDRRVELRQTFGIDVPQLRHLMLALAAEAS